MFSFTLHDLLEKNLGARSGHLALELGDETLTYGELGRRVESTAAWLAEQGIGRMDRVVVHMRKSFEEVVAMFAIWRIGAVAVNVHAQRTLSQLRYVVEDSGARIVFTDPRRARAIARDELIDRLGCIVTPEDVPHEKIVSWRRLPDNARAPDVRPVDRDLAALLYTSGSTGKPKGVMVSHLNLMDGTRRVADYLENRPSDRILGLVPMSAPWGVIQISSMMLVGGTVVLQPVALASEIVKTLASKRVTGMAAFPETWIDVVHYLQERQTALPELRYITSSGGQIPQPTLCAMPSVLPGVEVFLTYGLTEAFRSTYLPPDRFVEKMGSLGKPCKNVDVFVIDENGRTCGPGEQGELIHRGTLVTLGYWNRPEATAEQIRPCPPLRHLIGDEKVHYSGDIVRVDEDGYLWFVGRVEALLKSHGHRISPTEIEEVVHELATVECAVAFGIEDPQRGGQALHVAISAKDTGSGVDAEEVMRHCRARLPTYMMPSEIHIWEGQMPRTSNGKVDRLGVIDGCRARSAPAPGERRRGRSGDDT